MNICETLERLRQVGLSVWWEKGTLRLQAPWPPEEAPAEVVGLLEWMAENEKALEEALAPQLLFCPTCKRVALHINLQCQLCRPKGECPTCGGSDFWTSRWGKRVCRVCHPPAPGAEAV